ncbi:MAG TPA: class I SAM-dependent methyltransferase [Thermoanaerobaculia bacterium]
MNIRESYDSAARGYAEHLADELVHKPLDRHLLNRFAEEMRGRGLVADLGCGPGHVARYLHERGVATAGLDLSPGMVEVAASLHPGLDFRVDDMTRLSLVDSSLAGIVAFYSIVHFEAAELGGVFQQMRRVLVPGGLALVAFHIGEQVVHLDDLFGAPVSLDFRFHDPGKVVEALRTSRLPVIEHTEREPYEGAEHPSRRCYLLAKAV